MKARIIIIGVAMVLAACGGDGDTVNEEDKGDGGAAATSIPTDSDSGSEVDSADDDADQAPSGDGTRLLTTTGIGVTVVDLDNETQESLIDGIEDTHHLTLLGNTLWFGSGENLVVQADAISGEVVGTAEIPGRFEGHIAMEGDTAWIIAGSLGMGTELVAIDATNMSTNGSILPDEGADFRLVASAGGDIWVFGGDVDLLSIVRRVDTSGFTLGPPVDTGILGESMVGVGDNLWIGGIVPSYNDPDQFPYAAVARLTTASDTAEPLELSDNSDNAVVVASGFGSIWVTLGLDGELVKIDPGSGAEVDRTGVGDGAAGIPYPILFTDDYVWVFNDTSDELPAFDPDTLELETGINVPPFTPAPLFAP